MSIGSLGLNYLGLLLGILSIIATVYFAIRYAERKDPCLQVITDQKIWVDKEALRNIQIKYGDTLVNRVSMTTVWFWNHGKKPIRRDDVPLKQPLIIELDDSNSPVTILDVSVQKVSREAIDFSATKFSDSEVRIEFMFLDRGDGARVEVQHTGSRLTQARIRGVILGAPRGVRLVESSPVRLLLLDRGRLPVVTALRR